ncbi:MAG: hypothetical protein JSV42_03315 [Chloroflexota bacterium]|nr:MAG: hypothetical protein JSV42_03315 [Chloroflexota bacterium]
MIKQSIFISLCAILVLAGSAWAPNLITDFTASNEGDFVLLIWHTGVENGVSEYLVERSLDGLEFHEISDLQPMGNNWEYTYEDRDLYKTTSRTYYYRIHAILSNGSSSFSTVQSVSLSFSGIQQTWGSIKSLFR